MRILFGPSSYSPNLGGIEHLTHSLAVELQRTRHEVAVVTNLWPDNLSAEETVAGVDVRRIVMPAPVAQPASLLRYPAAVWRCRRRLRQILDSFQPDVVHLVGASWQAVHLAAAARANGLPCVLNLQGETAMDDARIYERSALLRRAFRNLVPRATAVVACSQWTLDHATTIAPAVPDGEVIPNGVDYDQFATLGPPPPTRRVLAFGRLVPNKGFDLLIRAATGASWELAIGGVGPAEPTLRRLADECGVNVDWLGRLDRAQVISELARASVVAVPSRMEPFGIVALEAMAAGRPVAVSSIGGMPEYVPRASVVNPHDIPALRSTIEQGLANPMLGLVGRQVAAGFAWPNVAPRWLDLYSRISARS